MNSYALLRTNVGLTTNVKIMVGSNYELYLDSIVSSPELSLTRYKKFRFDKDRFFDNALSVFFRNTPTDVSFKIRYDDDSDKMSNDFANQYDDIYQYGARNISANKYYSEEFEYFAPLFIDKKNVPTNFMIFRVDGPGLINLTKDNFISEIVNKMKFVKNYDLTLKTEIGQWINKNFKSNNNFSNSSLFVNFRKSNFSFRKGIDIRRGGYVERGFLLDDFLETEQTFMDMEKSILDGYKNDGVVFPNILNFSFLFDDTPATPTRLRKWSLNRYLGFYFDELTLIHNVSPCVLPKLRQDVIIESQNILSSPSSSSPFLENWQSSNFPYIEIDGRYYRVEEYDDKSKKIIQKIRTNRNSSEEKEGTVSLRKYKIISDIDLKGKTFSQINNNLIKIDNNNFISYQNGATFSISSYNTADLWLIKTGDRYHRVLEEDGKFKLFTDYGFKQSSDRFESFIDNGNPLYKETISLITKKDLPPVEFGIYKCKFTDIKDFDTEIVDTEFSKFQYEKFKELSNTDEPKMYFKNLESNVIPKENVQFKLQNRVVDIPVSSEYTANSETFRIKGDELNELWRKNSIRFKWGFSGSLSVNDYPYLLNNAFISENYNRCPNTKDTTLVRSNRNLDYFYSVNSSSADYTFHSLHIEGYTQSGLDRTFNFELDKYLGMSYSEDYFEKFFSKNVKFNNGKVVKQSRKYSIFQEGSNNIPNYTLFQGIKFKLQEVDSINILSNQIQKVNFKNSNNFYNWKFSILMSENKHIVVNTNSLNNDAAVIRTDNMLRWRIIDNWKQDKNYATNSLVKFNEILYTNPTSSSIPDLNVNPANSDEWNLYSEPTIFYSPIFIGFTNSNNLSQSFPEFPPLVYNSNEYYYSDGVSPWDFWDSTKFYSVDDIVTYNDENWKSLINSNNFVPSDKSGFVQNLTFINAWERTETKTRWEKVQLWKNNFEYSNNSSWNGNLFSRGNYVLHNGIVYGSTVSTLYGVEPNRESNWKRVYSLIPDTNFVYGNTILQNNIVEMNGMYYQCVSNQTNQPTGVIPNYSLDNGIMVIINEKFKNVLVNIYINDNTYNDVIESSPTIWDILESNISNTNRDDLYQTQFSKLSAVNFMSYLNDLSNKFGFSDNIKYVILGKDSKIKMYDFSDLKNISNIPYLLNCEQPDEFLVKILSNKLTAKSLRNSQIKINSLLKDSNIKNLSQLNWYNDIHLASEITKLNLPLKIIPNYSGIKNENFYKLYRYSGFYSPILKNVDLFQSPDFETTYPNYKFDTNLTDFGIIKQRIVSKVNRFSNLLKLKDSQSLKSIYPMVDEFGYHLVDFFIFKSTWDYGYHFECEEFTPQVFDNDLNIEEIREDDATRNLNKKLL